MSNIVGNYFRLGPLTETRALPRTPRTLQLTAPTGPKPGRRVAIPASRTGRLRYRGPRHGGGRPRTWRSCLDSRRTPRRRGDGGGACQGRGGLHRLHGHRTYGGHAARRCRWCADALLIALLASRHVLCYRPADRPCAGGTAAVPALVAVSPVTVVTGLAATAWAAIGYDLRWRRGCGQGVRDAVGPGAAALHCRESRSPAPGDGVGPIRAQHAVSGHRTGTRIPVSWCRSAPGAGGPAGRRG